MRYARALLLYATEQGVEDVIYKNMSQLVHTLDYVRELPVLLHAPVLTAEERVKIICEAVDGDEVFDRETIDDLYNLAEGALTSDEPSYVAHCYVDLNVGGLNLPGEVVEKIYLYQHVIMVYI